MRAAIGSAILAISLFAVAAPARADTVYEFVASCRRETLGQCFNRISERLDALKAWDQHSAYCFPPAYKAMVGDSYPISVIEYLRLALSAARFGESSRPTDSVITDLLARIYPCDEKAG